MALVRIVTKRSVSPCPGPRFKTSMGAGDPEALSSDRTPLNIKEELLHHRIERWEPHPSAVLESSH